MSRTNRLFALMQVLRRHRYPISAASLAEELGISPRTIYRDIATLQAQGAEIVGEPGVGYILRPGFMLPPLMFTEDEIEALVLGFRWVAMRTDSKLQHAAQNALAKIESVLPADLRHQSENSGLLIAPEKVIAAKDEDFAHIRYAIRKQLKLVIKYKDLKNEQSERVIWPIGLGFFEKVRILIAWCELRQDYRHFRTDQILELHTTNQRYPKPRMAMLKEWKISQNISTSS